MIKKIQKYQEISRNHFFSKEEEEEKKCRQICYPLSLPILGGCDSSRALQSSPFQNPGGSPERYGVQTNERRKSSCLILDTDFFLLQTISSHFKNK